VSLVAAATLLAAGAGCDAEEREPPADVSSESDDVVEGRIAHGHAEAVLVNLADELGPAGVCSGALVAPQVVLTAGHCVDGFTGWSVVAPFADRQWTRATRAEVIDWDVGMDHSLEKNDVAVILLDEPIVIDDYPVIASAPVEHGSEAVVVGRTLEGRPSDDWLFESDPIVLLHRMAGLPERPLYYIAPEPMIERGDSGGPVYAADDDDEGPRTIIGVVSATQYVYRVERQRAWVQSFIDGTDPT
jgi:hypothetical protein